MDLQIPEGNQAGESDKVLLKVGTALGEVFKRFSEFLFQLERIVAPLIDREGIFVHAAHGFGGDPEFSDDGFVTARSVGGQRRYRLA